MKEKIQSISITSLGIISFGIILMVFLKYLLPVLLPFIIAWLIAAITDPPAQKLSKESKLPPKITRLMMSLFLALTVALIIGLLIWRLTSAIWGFLTDIGEGNRLYDLLMTLLSPTAPILGEVFPDELAARISEAFGSLLSSALSTLATAVTSVVSGIPNALFFLLATVIAIIYFALDYDRIERFLSSVLPDKALSIFQKMRDGIICTIRKYVFSYSLLMLITYTTVFIGFLILRVENAPTIALFVALLDLLPVIGVGTVLIPWSIFELATGNQFLGIGLLILFVTNAVIRQLSEPKIIGKSLDIHPIIMLMLLYIGYRLFGVAGLLLLPVLVVGFTVALKKDSSAQIG